LSPLTQYVESILEQGREPIVEALAARRMDQTRLQTLAFDARTLADALGGKAMLTASKWTSLEAAAAKAQKEKWEACRRMIREVVRAYPDQLQALWSAC
jgi:predicted kinase